MKDYGSDLTSNPFKTLPFNITKGWKYAVNHNTHIHINIMLICLQLEKFYPDIYHIEDNTQYLKFVLQDRMFEVLDCDCKKIPS